MSTINKIPIDEYGEGNCCPQCNSFKVLKYLTCEIHKCINLKTGKEIYCNLSTNKVKKISNRDKAFQYDVATKSYYTLKCEKCGWTSKTFLYE